MEIVRFIRNRIYKICSERVMADFDWAALYEVETKALHQAVKRSIERSPNDFMFRLRPYAFIEQGIAMLSGVVRSERTIQMYIAIMRVFVVVRKIALLQHDVKNQLKQNK